MTLIIAEAGVNHNGEEKLAFALVDAAVAAGADIVKFQTFNANALATAGAQQASYQRKNTGQAESQLQMLRRLELSHDAHIRLQAYCASRGIGFLSTAFDEQSLQFLLGHLKLNRLKLPSGEITNAPFVLQHAKAGLPLIVSTGMANLAEIEAALGVIAFGLTASADAKPSQLAFNQAYASEQGQRALRQKVTLLHCTTEYPAPPTDINLTAMDTMAAAFGLPVGYSDHSAGIHIAIAAAARGATVLEKHFTLDKTLPGPDHKASLEPDELTAMVSAIRDINQALGDGIKRPAPSELANKAVARKSLVAACAIRAGETLTATHIACKRPGSGISPQRYWELLGTVAKSDFNEGDLLAD
ncbi:MAG: N-acetylneuraminate synthase [Gammaproteobacteria bacterium]|nr:N-acetylneuraminate synthase [Gammaproteobacteria bacterium]MBU1554121.1 N-acetylneuraminate synthase [Gammaproteobacteria bacterium]MBU2069583.1 N-acetylneuraminate synthase [Gammaproteobacteria bacterium]MBU2184448.1 N-acetylneuraminate synthase [Gammaproteobacteria bacterium]MBU2205751.1 N-acetylneuraminate synthase [Gammaproteobacteria bacterium]